MRIWRRCKKQKGIYRGRVRKDADQELLKNVIARFRKKEILLEEALKLTDFSKSTFYRRMREMDSGVSEFSAGLNVAPPKTKIKS